jgi:tetratricopeptide (TPR) repeat protein
MSDAGDVGPLHRYIALRRAGDRLGALAAAREACSAEPQAAPPFYALGEAETSLGDDAGAVKAFADALRRAPGWADAWINLGLALYRQGAMAAAKLAMREALKHAPGHAAATANLAAFMRITGEDEAAEAMLRESLAHSPEGAGARLNLAAEFLQHERGAEALVLLESGPVSPAALPQWHLTRISALLQLGRAHAARVALAEFEALGPVPPELAPLFYLRHVLLARMEGDASAALYAARQTAPAIERMGPIAVPEHRIMAHYDLAKFWSEQGNRPAAFAHWQAGHALLRVSQPFVRDRFSDFVETNIAVFNVGRFAGGARAANRDPAPVFITGMPRSGTTLCEQILAAHGQVHGAGERRALAWMAEALGGPRGIAALDEAGLDAAAERYLAELHDLAPGKTHIVDKMPGNELNLGLVALMLPGARIIHCERDPRDIGLSIWTFRFHGEHPYAHDLSDLGWTIAQRARLMAHWRAVLPNPILTVALHDWVRDFDGTLARVLAHLDLPPDQACARFYESDRDVRTVSRAQVRQPVHAKGLGRWRAYAAELAPLIAELDASNMLAAWDAIGTGG